MRKLIIVILLLMASINSVYSQSDVLTAEKNAANAMCPMAFGNGITMTHVTYDNGAFTYNYVVDEYKTTMLTIKQNLSTTAENIRALFEGSTMEYIKQSCINHNVVIIYRYVGTRTNEACWITYYPKTKKYTIMHE